MMPFPVARAIVPVAGLLLLGLAAAPVFPLFGGSGRLGVTGRPARSASRHAAGWVG